MAANVAAAGPRPRGRAIMAAVAGQRHSWPMLPIRAVLPTQPII